MKFWFYFKGTSQNREKIRVESVSGFRFGILQHIKWKDNEKVGTFFQQRDQS